MSKLSKCDITVVKLVLSAVYKFTVLLAVIGCLVWLFFIDWRIGLCLYIIKLADNIMVSCIRKEERIKNLLGSL